MKKILLFVFMLVAFNPINVSAVNVDDLLAQIVTLQAKIQQLQTQLPKTQTVTNATTCHTFNTNLKIGDTNTEVVSLADVLVKEGLLSTKSEGSTSTTSAGQKIRVYDREIASSVSALQEKYLSEILKPVALLKGTGYFGVLTRAKINQIYGCRNNNLGNTIPATNSSPSFTQTPTLNISEPVIVIEQDKTTGSNYPTSSTITGVSGAVETKNIRSSMDASEFTNLTNAVNEIGTLTVNLNITNNQNVNSSLVIPNNIKLNFSTNGRLTIATGVKLNIKGVVTDQLAGIIETATIRRQYFYGEGTVLLANTQIIYPEWFGAKGDWNGTSGTDNRKPLLQATASVPDGGTLVLDRGVYWISDVWGINRDHMTLTIKPGAELTSSSSRGTTDGATLVLGVLSPNSFGRPVSHDLHLNGGGKITNRTDYPSYIDNCVGILAYDFSVDNMQIGPCDRYGITAQEGAYNGTISNNIVSNVEYSGIGVGAVPTGHPEATNDNITIIGNKITNTGAIAHLALAGIFASHVKNLRLENNIINKVTGNPTAGTGSGIRVDLETTSEIWNSNVTLLNNQISDVNYDGVLLRYINGISVLGLNVRTTGRFGLGITKSSNVFAAGRLADSGEQGLYLDKDITGMAHFNFLIEDAGLNMNNAFSAVMTNYLPTDNHLSLNIVGGSNGIHYKSAIEQYGGDVFIEDSVMTSGRTQFMSNGGPGSIKFRNSTLDRVAIPNTW